MGVFTPRPVPCFNPPKRSSAANYFLRPVNAAGAQSEAEEPTRRAAEQCLSRLASEELSWQCQARLTACEGAAGRRAGLSKSAEEPIHAGGWLRRAWPSQTLGHVAPTARAISPAAVCPEWLGPRRSELGAL